MTGKFTRCLKPTRDWAGPHDVHRSWCLAGPHSDCGICPHHVFTIRLRTGIGNEIVACPRWSSDSERLHNVPASYGMVRRELCLTAQPFGWCPSCPNRNPEEPPRMDPGWWERERMLRKLEED
jgi:hypothetical protein